MKNKFFEYLDYYLVSEILYENLDATYIKLKPSSDKTAWIVNLEYTLTDGSIKKTTMAINEYTVIGEDPNVEKIKMEIRGYLSNHFPDYQRELYEYERAVKMLKIKSNETK